MSDSNSIAIHLLDKEYRISCPPGEQENLLQAANYLNEKMREVREAQVVGLEKIAVMAALNLAHELLQANQQLGSQQKQSSQLDLLMQRVDSEIQAFNDYRNELL